MEIVNNNIGLKFIPTKVVNFDEIERLEQIMKNDVFEKYLVNAKIEGELVVCNDTSKLKKFEKKIIRETYEDYKKFINNYNNNRDKWIYNIIDGISEQESIIYKDDLCIIIPTYTWNKINIDKLHILCIPTDKSLRCIRSLNSNHINLLEHMKEETLRVIKKKYGITEENLKIYFHYEPSTYHLHIHFVNILNKEMNSSVEYSHELNNVIYNISICSDYYQKVVLNKRI